MNYLPTIVSIISYVQIYRLLETINTESRIQTTTRITQDCCNKRCIAIAVLWLTWILVIVYILCQVFYIAYIILF